MSNTQVGLSNFDRGVSIFVAANSYKSRRLNEEILAQQYENNQQLSALRREIHESNEISKQILQNQLKIEENKEIQKFYKALSFNLSETLELISNIDDDLILKYIITNFYEKLKLNIIEANDNLEEISDKTFTKKLLDNLNSIKNKAELFANEFNKSALSKIDLLISDFKKEEKRISSIKEPSLEFIEIKRNRVNILRTISIVILGLITLFGVLTSLGVLFSSGPIPMIIFLIITSIFGIPFYKLLKKERKWRNEYDRFVKDQKENRIQFETNLNQLNTEHYNKILEEKENLLSHPLYDAILEINERHPEFEKWISSVNELETNFAIKWGLTDIGDQNQGKNKLDTSFFEAARVVVQNQLGSPALLQRKMKCGFNKANRLIKQLEENGIIGEANGIKPRKVLFANLDELNQYFETMN